jgi:hypothetical protein
MLKQLQIANEKQLKATGEGFQPLLILKNLMGHMNISTTEIYLQSLALDEAAISDSVSMLYERMIEESE